MFETYKSLLSEFVALRSVSTDPAFATEIAKTVKWLQRQFEGAGFQVQLLTSPRCNPVVVAGYDARQRKTTLIYGHYDVQPAAMDQGWNGDPYVLREADGRLYARGVVDNKGQILAHMVSVFERIKNNTLATNVTFLIEGNEETANPVLADLVEKHTDLLVCDALLVSDGEIMGEQPSLDASLRGGANLRVQLRTGATDLHSGLAGGAVPNAAKVLTDLLASLSDAQGKIKVSGFYDGVRPIESSLAAANAELAKTVKPADYGVKQFLSADDTDLYTQTGLYPTLQISGLSSGYTGEGFANIVPAAAEARLNLRTAPGQNTATTVELIEKHLNNYVPGFAEIKIEVEGEHEPVVLDLATPDANRARALLREVYGSEPIDHHVGGAIPVVADFKRLLGVDPILVSLGNDDCNMHGANENFRIDLIEKALKFSSAWFGK